MNLEEYYLDEHRKVVIAEIGDGKIVILVDLYPCNIELADFQHVTHRVDMDGIEVLVKPVDLPHSTYFNRAEIEMMCMQSKRDCRYISLRLYTSHHSLDQFKNKLDEVLYKIVNDIEKCVK
ncbi:MAG: hypothetical protein N3D82_03615 [Ignisphaera sp.]|nr:hypothetical protein [Ignisphaera sp.]MCX8168094.1 hypothetical protein [Ignisphaera sp.]MDW8085918.1 hypothetical protein [Ignisphaera sp.]